MSSEAVEGLGKPHTDNPRSVTALGKRFVKEFQSDDLAGMGAEVAYHLIFSIPPLILLVVMAAALVNQFTHVAVVSTLQTFVDQRAPAEMQGVLHSVITHAVGEVSGGAASIGAVLTALIALWSGSNGISSFMKGFNRAYDAEEDRSFIRKKLTALGLTLALIVSTLVAFALFVFGRQIGAWIAGRVGLGNLFSITWNVARWPVAVLFMMVVLSLLYYFGPNVEQSFRWVSAGSVVATVLWVAAVFGFKLYLALSNPGSTYGAFGGLVVFLFFLYVTSIIFLLGAELNAVLERRFEGDMAGSPVTRSAPVDGGTARQDVRASLEPAQPIPQPELSFSRAITVSAPPDAGESLLGDRERPHGSSIEERADHRRHRRWCRWNAWLAGWASSLA